MKTHYQRPFLYGTLCNKKGGKSVDQYQEATCFHCIARMSPGEMMWHDKNNQEWIEHKRKDGRRGKRTTKPSKKIVDTIVIPPQRIKVSLVVKDSQKKGIIKSLFNLFR